MHSNLKAMHVRTQLRQLTVKAMMVVMLAMEVCAGSAPAEPATLNEYQVKSAYLFNFARFVEWPTNRLGEPGMPLVIGVVGDDPFGAVLDKTVAGKTVNGRPLSIRRLAASDDLQQCDLLFISSSETPRLDAIMAQLGHAAVLTVGENDSFLAAGGIIQFVDDEGTREI